jgi:hypothetical protein
MFLLSLACAPELPAAQFVAPAGTTSTSTSTAAGHVACGEAAPALTSIAASPLSITLDPGPGQVQIEVRMMQVVADATDADGDLHRVEVFAWLGLDDGLPVDPSALAPVGSQAHPSASCTTFAQSGFGAAYSLGEGGLAPETSYRAALAVSDAEGNVSDPLEIVFVTPPEE